MRAENGVWNWSVVGVVWIALLALTVHPVLADNLSPVYRWDQEANFILKVDSWTDYDSYVASAVEDLDSSTNLAVETCEEWCNIVFYQDYWGFGVAALTHPFSWYDGDWHDCLNWTPGPNYLSPNGACNDSTHRVHFSWIYYNNSFDLEAGNYHHNRPRHELMHVLGFSHNSDVSVLNQGRNDQTLQTVDITDVNSFYYE